MVNLRGGVIVKERKKSFLFYLVVMSVIIATLFPGSRAAAESDILDIKGHSAILVDANTGMILYEKESDTALPTASMTKMMTEYLVLEAIKDGKISWEQETGISEYVYKISQFRSLSNVPLRLDGTYTVKELYEAMAIYSANGATIALAELVAGSETNFVKMMNDKAEELKLVNYKFVNSTGLNNKDLLGNHPKGTDQAEENLMSAKATATLAYNLLKDYPEVLDTASIPTKVFREGTEDSIDMINWNEMLPGLGSEYAGVDGLKTGSTDLAGYCFTGTATKGDTRFISVVMKTDSRTARFVETKKLLDYGFSNFEKLEVVAAGYQEKGKKTVKVQKGKENTVEIEAAKPIALLVKRGEKENYKPVVKISKKSVEAPVKEGTKVGTVTVEYKGEGSLSFLTEKGGELVKSDIVTTDNVEKANWFVLLMKAIGGFFGDLWTSSAEGIKGLF
ncbi:D-alanyl-D-alanine carboxypeptidase [Bacillus sp. BGMRC 2118]|nr:D-alanyl-D-alanine carboxypeptidase [Bacillus sp. BGMRC 2118]